jgi:uncharacterized membrane protein
MKLAKPVAFCAVSLLCGAIGALIGTWLVAREKEIVNNLGLPVWIVPAFFVCVFLVALWFCFVKRAKPQQYPKEP